MLSPIKQALRCWIPRYRGAAAVPSPVASVAINIASDLVAIGRRQPMARPDCALPDGTRLQCALRPLRARGRVGPGQAAPARHPSLVGQLEQGLRGVPGGRSPHRGRSAPRHGALDHRALAEGDPLADGPDLRPDVGRGPRGAFPALPRVPHRVALRPGPDASDRRCASELPIVYHEEGGGAVELGRRYGIPFRDDVRSAILEARARYVELRARVLDDPPSGDRMCVEYGRLLQRLCALNGTHRS
jgi:hypothetical protein